MSNEQDKKEITRKWNRRSTENLRQFRKDMGFVRVEVWVHKDDRSKIIAESVRMYNAKLEQLR